MVDSTAMQSGRYQAYPEYKDSGVEWLGEIPNGWIAQKLKFLCTYNDEVLPESTPKDKEIVYVDIGSVSATEGITNKETITYENSPSRARRIVKDGDVIISTVRTYLEAIAPINNPPENMVVSTGFAVIRPKNEFYKGFASYSLRFKGFIGEVVSRSVGVSYPAINSSDLVNIEIPTPPFNEQEKIANFLDFETAKIDTLIEKQQRLIELLTEKRQAVISHAVTKGLNPEVPMKDSGVEWLGEVPAHWEMKKLKHVTTYNDDVLSEKTDANFKIQYVDISSVSSTNGIQDSSEIVFKDAPSRARRVVKDGDVIVSTVRTYLRAIAPIVNPPANLIVSTGFTVIRPKNEMFKDYVSNFLLSEVFISEVVSRSVGISYPAINSSDLMDIYICKPPHNEQVLICEYISSVLQKIDVLISKSSKQIQLMQERRTALISAAVTGKIDVREWVQPE